MFLSWRQARGTQQCLWFFPFHSPAFCTGQLCSAPALDSQQPAGRQGEAEVCCGERAGDEGTGLSSGLLNNRREIKMLEASEKEDAVLSRGKAVLREVPLRNEKERRKLKVEEYIIVG